MTRKLQLRFRYYMGEIYKNVFGTCYKCGDRLNFTRHGQGICPNVDCRARY